MKSVQSVKWVFLLCSILSPLILFSQNHKSFVVAHRGASAVAPENTLAAFKKAIEMGTDYIELDIVNSKEDSLMVIHDHELDRTTNGTGFVFDYTYPELRQLSAGIKFGNPDYINEKIPTLYEVLALAKGKCKVIIEMKVDYIFRQVSDLINKMDMYESTIVYSWDIYPLDSLSRYDKKVNVMYSHDQYAEEDLIKINSLGIKYMGYGGNLTDEFLQLSKYYGLKIFKWTASTPAEMIVYNRQKVFGILVDNPIEMIKIITTQPPPIVPSVVAKFTNNSIQVDWGSPIGTNLHILGYEIQYSVNSDTFKTISINDLNRRFILPSPSENSTYDFRVKAFNDVFFNSEEWSPIAHIAIPADNIRPTVTFVSSIKSPDQILLHFSESVSFPDLPLDSIFSIEPKVNFYLAEKYENGTVWILKCDSLSENINYIISFNPRIADNSQAKNKLSGSFQLKLNYQKTIKHEISNWKFDESDQETITENVINPDLYGVISGDFQKIWGSYNRGIKFNGKNTSISIPNITQLQMDTNQVSISIWIKTKNLASEYPLSTGPIFKSLQDYYSLYFSRLFDELRFKVTTTTGNQVVGIPSLFIKRNEWNFIVGTYNGKVLSVYLNGKLIRTAGLSGNVLNNQRSFIGSGNNGTYFNGAIDELAIYNRELTIQEIETMYFSANKPSGDSVENNKDHVVVFPKSWEILSIYPNPFNLSTTIKYQISSKSVVTVSNYNLLGQKLNSFQLPETTIGEHEVNIPFNNLASGLYFLTFSSGNQTIIKKVQLIK